jgi:hypothetical protein
MATHLETQQWGVALCALDVHRAICGTQRLKPHQSTPNATRAQTQTLTARGGGRWLSVGRGACTHRCEVRSAAAG